MSVGIGEATPYFLELEAITDDGPPRVRATIYNVDGTQEVNLKRSVGGDPETIQGGRQVRISDAGIINDWAAPLNREITYTVFVDGQPQGQGTITLKSDTSWIQDPMHPAQGLPLYRQGNHPGALTLDKESLKDGTQAAENTQIMVLGSRLPRYFGGVRQAQTGISVSVYSPDEETTDAFQQMIEDAPILLIRTADRLRPLPPVAYLAAVVVEHPHIQDEDDVFTEWSLEGNLVQAIMRAALSGGITYQDVQDLLGGFTYDEVQAAAKATTYLDWLKDPLLFEKL